jgi:hypothetical protein
MIRAERCGSSAVVVNSLWSRESPWKWLMFNTATKTSPGEVNR